MGAEPGRQNELKAQLEARLAQFEAAGARLEKRAGRNLFQAVGTGLVFGAVFVAAVFFSSWTFALLVAVLLSVAQIELATAFRAAGSRVPRIGVILCGLLIMAAAYFWGPEGMLHSLLVASVLLTLWRLIEALLPRYEATMTNLLRDVFAGLFSLVYLPFLASFAIVLRQAEHGEWWIFAFVCSVVAVDTGAYAAGVTLGKHKMAPRISPGKTWEGFAGAALTAVVVCVLLAVFMLQQPLWVGLVLGPLVLCCATVGDLMESLIKRTLGVKDISRFLPGHGGFLDRLDSLLPSAVGFYCVALVLGVVA